MPELPEVEVVRQELANLVVTKPTIEKIEFMRKDLRDPMPIKKIQAMVGAQILSVHRRAKYLLIETSAGGLLSHLGMTGTWRVAPLGEEKNHDHIYIYLSSGLRLAFRDPRRFGIFETFDMDQPKKSSRLKFLGPEPLESEFDAKTLYQNLKSRKSSVKAALMDQKIVVGVGNIYASEALFLAQIKPQTRANKVSLGHAQKLVSAIRQVLSEAIAAGGSSISDFKNSKGMSGYFQDRHQVYGRQGEPCLVCQTKLRSQVIAGRSTFWCPCCQK